MPKFQITTSIQRTYRYVGEFESYEAAEAFAEHDAGNCSSDEGWVPDEFEFDVADIYTYKETT